MSVLQDRAVMPNDFENDNRIDQFVIQVPTVQSDLEGHKVKKIFDSAPYVEGVVVMENSRAVGIVMRTDFYQKMGSLYGNSLYANRPVNILMDPSVLTVNINDNISKIGIQAMNRDQNKLHDFIVVMNQKVYLGVISIRLFLVELSKRNEAQISVLTEQQKKLICANEQEILLRKDLEYQSASIRNLLDHADQGFLWFDSTLKVKIEYSYKCLDIFQRSIGGENYIALMSECFAQEKISVFQATFDSYFNNNSPVSDQVYLMLLPSDCEMHGKNIHFEYRRIESDGKKAVMVMLNDVTEKIQLELSLEQDHNKQRLLIKAFGYQAQIKRLLEEFHEMFDEGYKQIFLANQNFQEGLNELFRAVHTFKGDFAQYGFLSASEQIHEFEDKLFDIIGKNGEASLSDVENVMQKADSKEILKSDLEIIYEVLGDSYFDQSEIITISKSKLDEIEQQIKKDGAVFDQAAMLNILQSLKRKNIKAFLNQYNDYIQYLSDRVMKNSPIYIVEGDDVEIDCDEYADFLKALVHIYRNIMDHGIETDEERLEFGKSERGLIECRISKSYKGWMTIRISDDGRGIDLNKLKSKAVVNGLYTQKETDSMTDIEAANLIFENHLSTKDVSDTLSGRGMGMSAVMESCLSLGGKVEIETKSNEGTAFIITLPYTN